MPVDNNKADSDMTQHHGDAIWEHKKGRVWLIVQRQERDLRTLRYQVKVLQARCRRHSRLGVPS